MNFRMRSQKNINTTWRQGLSLGRTDDSLQPARWRSNLWNCKRILQSGQQHPDSRRNCALPVTAIGNLRSGHTTEHRRGGLCLLTFEDALQQLTVRREFRIAEAASRGDDVIKIALKIVSL
jgi:hypothetical protein